MNTEHQPLSLWSHQKQAILMALTKKDFAFFMDTGTGKTGTLINVLRYKFADQGHVMRTVIISPLVTLQNWKEEFKRFSKVDPADIVVLKGTGGQKYKLFLKTTMDPITKIIARNRIIIMNYESTQNEDLMAAILTWNPEILVLDEAHRAKNPKGVRSMAITQIADRARHKYLLTGTPILNDSKDVFQLYRILDGGKTFGDNFFAFRGKYFVDKNAGFQGKPQYFPDWQERIELRGEISKKMYFDDEGRPKAHRVLKKDCLDLPPFMRVQIRVELSVEQRKMYEEMKKEFLTFVEKLSDEGKPLAVVANLAVTKAIRLQQITAGFVKAEDGGEYPIENNPRLKALEDLLSDAASGSKVIVWATFRQNYTDIARVCEKLKLKYRMLHGGVSASEKEQNMQDFRSDPEIKVMIANQAAAGVGVNLVEAPISIFYSRDFNYGNDVQAEARNYRGGSEMHEKVTRYDFIAEDTIDELVAEVLSLKQSVADQILDISKRL